MSVRSGHAILVLALALGLLDSSLALRAEDDTTDKLLTEAMEGRKPLDDVVQELVSEKMASYTQKASSSTGSSSLVDVQVAGRDECLYSNKATKALHNMEQCNAARGCLWEWIEAYCLEYTTHEEDGCCLPHGDVKDPPPVAEVMGALHAAEQAVEQMQREFEADVDAMAETAKDHDATEDAEERMFLKMRASKQKSRRLRELHALVAVYEQKAQQFFNAFQEFAFSDLKLKETFAKKVQFEVHKAQMTLSQVMQTATEEITGMIADHNQKRLADARELLSIFQEAGNQVAQIQELDVDHDVHPTVDGATAKVVQWAMTKVNGLCPKTPSTASGQPDNTELCNILKFN